MKLILLKHGRRDPAHAHLADAEQGLDPRELHRVEAVRGWLDAEAIAPRRILTSRHRHAVDTAHAVRCARTRTVVEVSGLTPGTAEAAFSLEAILLEGAAAGLSWPDDDVIMLVGHETRLSQLAARLLAQPRGRYLHHLEALVISVDVRSDRSYEPREVST
jgi:phosphohistidine phosphatase SixA